MKSAEEVEMTGVTVQSSSGLQPSAAQRSTAQRSGRRASCGMCTVGGQAAAQSEERVPAGAAATHEWHPPYI